MRAPGPVEMGMLVVIIVCAFAAWGCLAAYMVTDRGYWIQGIIGCGMVIGFTMLCFLTSFALAMMGH